MQTLSFTITINQHTQDEIQIYASTKHLSTTPPIPDITTKPLTIKLADLTANLMEHYHDARSYGKLLGERLFTGAIRDQWMQALGTSCQRIIVELNNRHQFLNTLHWSWLCGPVAGNSQWGFFNQHQRFTYSIVVSTDQALKTTHAVDESLAFIVNNPAANNDYALEPFSIDYVKTLQRQFSRYRQQVFTVDNTSNINHALRQHCTDHHCKLLHILAHGSVRNNNYLLYLWDQKEPLAGLSANQFIEYLNQLLCPPMCIVLSLCYSSANPEYNNDYEHLAYRLVSEVGVAYVIGMTDQVNTNTAEEFSIAFYKSLAKTNNILSAFNEAILSIQHRDDALVPMLYHRTNPPLYLFNDITQSPNTANKTKKPKRLSNKENSSIIANKAFYSNAGIISIIIAFAILLLIKPFPSLFSSTTKQAINESANTDLPSQTLEGQASNQTQQNTTKSNAKEPKSSTEKLINKPINTKPVTPQPSVADALYPSRQLSLFAIQAAKQQQEQVVVKQALANWLNQQQLDNTITLLKPSFISDNWFQQWYSGNGQTNQQLQNSARYLLLANSDVSSRNSNALNTTDYNLAGLTTSNYSLDIRVIDTSSGAIISTLNCQQAGIGNSEAAAKALALENCINTLDTKPLLLIDN